MTAVLKPNISTLDLQVPPLERANAETTALQGARAHHITEGLATAQPSVRAQVGPDWGREALQQRDWVVILGRAGPQAPGAAHARSRQTRNQLLRGGADVAKGSLSLDWDLDPMPAA